MSTTDTQCWLSAPTRFPLLVGSLEDGYLDTVSTGGLEQIYLEEIRQRLSRTFEIVATRFYVSHKAYGFFTKPFDRVIDQGMQVIQVNDFFEFRPSLLFEWCEVALDQIIPVAGRQYESPADEISTISSEIYEATRAFAPWYPRLNAVGINVDFRQFLVVTALLRRLHSLHMQHDKPGGLSPFDPFDYVRSGVKKWEAGQWPSPHLASS